MEASLKKRPLRKLSRWLRLPLHRHAARHRIDGLNAGALSLDALVDGSIDLGTRGLLKVRARQIRWEIRALAAAVSELAPRNVVEIGTFRGGTLWLWAHLACCRVVTLDVNQPARMVDLFLRMAPPGSGCRVIPIEGNSQAPEILASVKNALGGEPIDFLFIDGDHSLPGVRADFEHYAPLVRPGGLVGFHDIAPKQPFEGNQVQHFWPQLRARYETKEFIDHPDQVGYGIGIVRMPS